MAKNFVINLYVVFRMITCENNDKRKKNRQCVDVKSSTQFYFYFLKEKYFYFYIGKDHHLPAQNNKKKKTIPTSSKYLSYTIFYL